MKKVQYPNAVVMKKNIIYIAVACMIIVVFTFLYAFNAGDERVEDSTQSKQTSQSVTSAADMGQPWYQTRVINKTVFTPPALTSVPAATADTDKQTTDTQAPVSNADNDQLAQIKAQLLQAKLAQMQQEQADYQKAMQAPISSNQINGSNSGLSGALPGGSKMATLANALISKEGGSSGSDANMQSEKKDFVQQNTQATDEDYLSSQVRNPKSLFEVKAGTIIPGIMISGVNSDLPGQIIGQVRSNVYDTVSGQYVLIPQGTRIIGLYDSQIAYGQERILIAWKRIIFPNGQSLDLQGMPGVDLSGYAGFKDQVNNHYAKMFGSVLLLSVLDAGAQLSQPQQQFDNNNGQMSVNQTIAQSLGTNLANTGDELLQKDIDIQPTLQIRPGYEFNIMVTKDLTFSGAYPGAT
ncbi:MAG: TrbI/VirB10 family protein [Gammaproteobacteria bacterium]